jgi:hypothetical protein
MGLRASAYDCQVSFLIRENDGVMFLTMQPAQLRRLIV